MSTPPPDSPVTRYTVGYYDGEWHVSEESSDIARGLYTFVLATDYDRDIKALENENRRLHTSVELLDALPDAHLIAEQVETIRRLLLAGETTSSWLKSKLRVQKELGLPRNMELANVIDGLDAALRGKNGE